MRQCSSNQSHSFFLSILDFHFIKKRSIHLAPSFQVFFVDDISALFHSSPCRQSSKCKYIRKKWTYLFCQKPSTAKNKFTYYSVDIPILLRTIPTTSKPVRPKPNFKFVNFNFTSIPGLFFLNWTVLACLLVSYSAVQARNEPISQ